MPDSPPTAVRENDTPSTALPSEGAAPQESDTSLVIHPQAARSSGILARFRYPILAAGIALLLSPLTFLWPGEAPVDPSDYAERTKRVLKSTP